MMNLLAKTRLFTNCLSLPRLSCVATLKVYPVPPSYKDVDFPEQRKLRFLEKTPIFPPGMRPVKGRKRLIDIRGPELVHNSLIHKQYGIIALKGGYLHQGHLEMIRNTINRQLETKRMFAVWRVDAPWKPKTKKPQGTRMGGGKANIHHYVTPVKAGRVIIEVGGVIQFMEVQKMLEDVSKKLPFDAMIVSQDKLEAMKAEERRIEEENINPYTFKYIIENNMLGCHSWISPYDLIWHGKHR